MKIRIILPYAEADSQAGLWAISEEETDFRNDPVGAARCTVAFAAMELKDHLQRCVTDAEVSVGSVPVPEAFPIFLEIESPSDPSESYELLPEENGLRIRGAGRVG